MRRQAVELGEQRLLHLEALGRVLLHVIGAGERRAQDHPRRCRRASMICGVAPFEQIIRGKVGRHGCDEVDRPSGRVAILIPERDVMARASEGDRPGACR